MEQLLWDKRDNPAWDRGKEKEREESMGAMIEPVSCNNSKI